MAYQALYRKYRPLKFDEVVGQEHITETLKNEIASGKTVHAYLFTGTRGTGKTTCAKILAKAINCLDSNDGQPCLNCASCERIANGEDTDIVEIDAASNNGVDNIRELRDLINFTPSAAKYRVFIIDEVHMLSIGAFNALLKTLEEPPKHVVFILATTEVHKLPATILSRCQRLDFRRIDADVIKLRLKEIAEKENLTITDEAATLIASAADGGMRDALSILDLCASSARDIDEAIVENVCAMAGNDFLFELSECILNKQSNEALLLVDKLNNSSVDMMRLLSELTSHFRDLMIVKTVTGNNKPVVCSKAKLARLEEIASKFSVKDIVYILDILQSSFANMQAGNKRLEMELAIIKICNPKLSSSVDALEQRIASLEKQIAYLKSNPVKTEVAEILEVEEPEEITEIEEIVETKEPAQINEDTPLSNWGEIIKIVKKECPLFGGVLNDSRGFIKGDFLLIDAPNESFRTMINSGNPIYKESIKKAAFEILGKAYKLGPYTKVKKVEEADPLAILAEKLKHLETN